MDVSGLVAIPVNTPEALAYTYERNLVWIAEVVLAVAIPSFFLFTKIGARLRSWCARIVGGRWFGTVTLFACIYLILSALISLPLEYFGEVSHRAAWGRSTGSLPQWLAGKAGGLLIVLVATSSLIWAPYALITKYPRRWWLYGTAVLVPLFTCALVVMQIWVMPLTTELKPLVNTALAVKIQALAAQCGLGEVPLFVGGGSDTVVGLGPVTRIIFAARTMDGPEEHILYTASHELKHYVMSDNWLAIAIVAGIILAGLWLVQVLGRVAIDRWGKQFGFSALTDPASLPLIILIVTAYWFLIGLPTFNGVQRYVEFEADRFALELTRDNQAQAMALAPFAEEPFQLNEYRWFDRVFRANHPSNAERIRLANTYMPWENGGALVYGEVCPPPSAD